MWRWPVLVLAALPMIALAQQKDFCTGKSAIACLVDLGQSKLNHCATMIDLQRQLIAAKIRAYEQPTAEDYKQLACEPAAKTEVEEKYRAAIGGSPKASDAIKDYCAGWLSAVDSFGTGPTLGRSAANSANAETIRRLNEKGQRLKLDE